MRRRRNFLAWVVVSLALTSSVLGDEGDESPGLDLQLDLQRVVELTLAGNPALKAIEERRSEVEAAIGEARAGALPEVDLVASWGRSRNPAFLNSPDFEDILAGFPDGQSFKPGTQELYSLAVELRQAIYSGGRLAAAIDLAEVASTLSEVRIGVARLDAAQAAAEAYYRWLTARGKLTALEIQRAVREAALEVVEDRFEFGDATRLDQLRARSALAEVQPTVARTVGEVAVAEQELRARLALKPEVTIEAQEVTESPPAVPLDVEALTLEALGRRPELADLDLQGEVLGLQARIEVSDGRPQVELNSAFGREARLIEDLPEPLFDNWRLSLDLRWQLFDGGARRNRLAQLESQGRQLDWQRRDLVQQVRLEIERAVTGYRTAWATWQASEVAAETAREAHRVAQESYREGVALQSDLLAAQQQEALVELRKVEAYYLTWIEATRLDRALGRLPGGGRLPSLEMLERETGRNEIEPLVAAEESP